MITYIKGDLFTTTDKYIAHGVNCGGVMGAGVALLIKQKYPEVFKDYQEYCDLADPYYLLGRVRKSPTNDGKIILNCFTQLHYGKKDKRFVSYDAIDNCMRNIYLNGIDSVSMPMIGAGLGGGEWSIIEQIIDHNLRNANVKIYQYEVEKNA